MFGFLIAVLAFLAIVSERLIFAISIVMIAMWLQGKIAATKARLARATAGMRATASHTAENVARRYRYIFGATQTFRA